MLGNNPSDFKKEFYMPNNKPTIVEIPKMNFISVRGAGNPNEENGDYKNSIGLLYSIVFTIKMIYKENPKIEEYTIPPLEGFWWQDEIKGIDYKQKQKFNFISIIRLPDFITKEEFDKIIKEASKKNHQDFSRVEFLKYDEGLCVQCIHFGSYDNEPITIELMHNFMKENGYELDITDKRYHHEIYLSDPKECDKSKLITMIRLPIKKFK